jgi:hypothetical protein
MDICDIAIFTKLFDLIVEKKYKSQCSLSLRNKVQNL